MAVFILPTLEPCRIPFDEPSWNTWGRHYNTPRQHRFEAVIKEFRQAFTPAGTYYCAILCPERNDLDAIRAALPWRYGITEDGAFYREGGSTIQTHWSVTHLQEVFNNPNDTDHYVYREMTVYKRTADAGPDDAFWGKRNSLLGRNECGSELSTRNFNHKGEWWTDFEIIVNVDSDPDILVHRRPTGLIAAGSHWANVGSEVRVRQVENITLPSGAESATLWDCYIYNVYQETTSRIKISQSYSSVLLKNRPKFNDVLRYKEGYVRPKKDAQKAAVRRVILDDREVHRFGEQDFVATRCNGPQEANSHFVRLGLRWSHGKASLANYGGGWPAHFLHDYWDRHAASTLVHKAEDGWRIIFMLPIILQSPGIESRLSVLPAFYMIPQFVDRNEVTFSDLTFRGVALETQEAIWSVKGMSMALNRALMGLAYQTTLIPMRGGRVNINSKIPEHHRVGLMGRGLAGLAHLDMSLKDCANMPGGRSIVRADGHYDVETQNSRFSVHISRAVDILDTLFYGLPSNMITPSARMATQTTRPIARNVRL